MIVALSFIKYYYTVTTYKRLKILKIKYKNQYSEEKKT